MNLFAGKVGEGSRLLQFPPLLMRYGRGHDRGRSAGAAAGIAARHAARFFARIDDHHLLRGGGVSLGVEAGVPGVSPALTDAAAACGPEQYNKYC